MAPSNIIRGRAIVYSRPHINTDEIIPGRYLSHPDESLLAQHAMEDIDSNFVKKVRLGDILVVGENFGCGSSREHAVWALRGAGIAAVVAASFARIFFRNAINNGFLVIECPAAVQETAEGDEMEINLDVGQLRNLNRGTVSSFAGLPDFAKELLAAGGLMPYVAKRKAAQ